MNYGVNVFLAQKQFTVKTASSDVKSFSFNHSSPSVLMQKLSTTSKPHKWEIFLYFGCCAAEGSIVGLLEPMVIDWFHLRLANRVSGRLHKVMNRMIMK